MRFEVFFQYLQRLNFRQQLREQKMICSRKSPNQKINFELTSQTRTKSKKETKRIEKNEISICNS
jgi:hypothetical protein